jgi:hypothetical protein
VSLPVLPGVAGVGVAPLFAAVAYDLGILGVGFDLTAVVVPLALPLAVKTTAHELLGTKAGRLKQLLAITTAAITHQAGSGSGCEPFIVSEWQATVMFQRQSID